MKASFNRYFNIQKSFNNRLIAGYVYQLRAALKFDSTQCLVGFKQANRDYKLFGRQDHSAVYPFPSNTWAIATGRFIAASSSDYLTISFNCNGQQTAFFDNIVLEKVSSQAYTLESPAVGPDVVPDGGFDILPLSTYQVDANAGVTVAIDGQQNRSAPYAVDISMPEMRYGSTLAGGVSQIVTLDTAKVYRVTAYTRFLVNGECFSNLIFGSTDTGLSIYYSDYIPDNTVNTWLPLSLVVLPQYTSMRVWLQGICFPAIGAGVQIFFDDVEVVPLSSSL